MTLNNWPLYLILLSTLGPALLANVLFNQNQEQDQANLVMQGKQAGHFLEFPIKIKNSNSFNHQQWHLIKISDDCSSDCQHQVQRLYAILSALGKRRDKADFLLRSAQDFAASSGQEETYRLLNQYSAFIATPQGEIILGYKSNQLDKSLLKDLKHLIKVNPIMAMAKQG